MRNGDYEMVLADDDYPHALYRGKYCYEHRLVWWRAHGEIPDGFDVHHINGDKRDNCIKNLRAMSRSEHARLHALEQPRPQHEHGTAKRYWQGCRCPECRTANSRHSREYKANRKKIGV